MVKNNYLLLRVPPLDTGTGVNQAYAMLQTLEDWCTIDKVQALSCDTTASNTGHIEGACVLFEQHLQRDILYLPLSSVYTKLY